MRIEEIKLKNIGPFEEETIRFQPIPNGEKKAEVHIFTGPNGSGKSTILHALATMFHYRSEYVDINGIKKRFHTVEKLPYLAISTNNNQIYTLLLYSYRL
ncbi:MAG: AAA family ATPase [Chitinophagales bacterium]